MQLIFDEIEFGLSGRPNKAPVLKLLHPIVMKVVCSSVNLLSCLQLSYLLLVAFLVAIAFGSDEAGHPSGAEEKVRKY